MRSHCVVRLQQQARRESRDQLGHEAHNQSLVLTNGRRLDLGDLCCAHSGPTTQPSDALRVVHDRQGRNRRHCNSGPQSRTTWLSPRRRGLSFTGGYYSLLTSPPRRPEPRRDRQCSPVAVDPTPVRHGRTLGHTSEDCAALVSAPTARRAGQLRRSPRTRVHTRGFRSSTSHRSRVVAP
jgi:hypothetical protein